jgi:hypothetical protein
MSIVQKLPEEQILPIRLHMILKNMLVSFVLSMLSKAFHRLLIKNKQQGRKEVELSQRYLKQR